MICINMRYVFLGACKWIRAILILTCIFMNVTAIHAQNKIEREYRIKDHQVPASARIDVGQFNFPKKIRWYIERNVDTFSVEAKTKTDLGCISIEFSPEGEFMDLELEVKDDMINASVLRKIGSYFDANFRRWKMRKIQLQYSHDIDLIRKQLEQPSYYDPIRPRYEIVAKGRDEHGMKLYEFLFGEDGSFVKKQQFTFKPVNNLQF